MEWIHSLIVACTCMRLLKKLKICERGTKEVQKVRNSNGSKSIFYLVKF